MNTEETGRVYLSPDDDDDNDTNEKRKVRRLNRMLRDTKDNKEFDEMRHLDNVSKMRLGELLEKNTMESQQTIILYFINLVAMVFLLLIYVGLAIIMIIAFLLHSWDRYNG